MKTAAELQNDLKQCYGTGAYYNMGPLIPFLITDGVRTFIEGADAFWFLSHILSYIDTFKKNYMTVIKLKVKNEEADVELIDDNDKHTKGQHISYTDCPEGEYTFYMFWKDSEKPILIWYMEY